MFSAKNGQAVFAVIFLFVVALGIAAAALSRPPGLFRTAVFPQESEDAGQEAARPVPGPDTQAAGEPSEEADEDAAAERQRRQLEPSDYQQDWRESGAGEGRLGDRLRSHRVRLIEGVLHGRMIVLAPETGDEVDIQQMTVYFLQGGEVIARSRLSTDGQFAVEGLSPGVYGLVAAGADGFAAYSLQVLGDPIVEEAAGRPDLLREVAFLQEEVSQLQIETLVVPPGNFTALKELIRNYVPSQVAATEWLEPERDEIAASARVFERERGPGALPAGPNVYHRATTDDEAVVGTSIRHHSVYLQADGSLLGRVRRLHPTTGRPLRPRRVNIFMLREDQIVAQVPVEENGVFIIENFPPAAYSMVSVARGYFAAGFEGFAAFSVNVLPAPPAAAEAVGDLTSVPVSHRRIAESFEFDFALLGAENLALMRAIAAVELPRDAGGASPPLTAPSGSVSGTGGGGGGGAGGGLDAPFAAAAAGAAFGLGIGTGTSGDRQMASPFRP